MENSGNSVRFRAKLKLKPGPFPPVFRLGVFIMNFLAQVPVQAIPWQKYELN